MSKYPLFVTFTEDSNFLDVSSVSYTKPLEGYWIKIEEADKWKYFGSFGPKIEGRYYIDWYVGTDGKPAGIPSYEIENGFNTEPYLEIIWGNIATLIEFMLSMDEVIGDIWKWPDPLDCFLYAQTEASEVIESILLQVRNTDSRNSKQVSDYDTAIEMFDVTMMLTRGLVALLRDLMIANGYDWHAATVEERSTKLWGYIQSFYWSWSKRYVDFEDTFLASMDVNEPEYLSAMVSYITTFARTYYDPESMYKGNDIGQILDHIFAVFKYVIFHPVVQYVGYDAIAQEKLMKITTKSLSKKAQIVNQVVN